MGSLLVVDHVFDAEARIFFLRLGLLVPVCQGPAIFTDCTLSVDG